MGFYIGIDCSSRSIHFVVLDVDEKIILMDKCVDSSKDIEARFNNVCTQFSDYITKQSDLFLDSMATIENPVMIQNVKATIMITNVIAGVKRELFRNDIPYWAIDNKSWKKDVLGNGAASKEEILKFAEMKWGKVFTEQDYADSACIALWGLVKFGRTRV